MDLIPSLYDLLAPPAPSGAQEQQAGVTKTSLAVDDALFSCLPAAFSDPIPADGLPLGASEGVVQWPAPAVVVSSGSVSSSTSDSLPFNHADALSPSTAPPLSMPAFLEPLDFPDVPGATPVSGKQASSKSRPRGSGSCGSKGAGEFVFAGAEGELVISGVKVTRGTSMEQIAELLKGTVSKKERSILRRIAKNRRNATVFRQRQDGRIQRLERQVKDLQAGNTELRHRLGLLKQQHQTLRLQRHTLRASLAFPCADSP